MPALVNALAGLSILMIGDSHLASSAYLITTLHDSLTGQGAAVHSIGVCGVTASHWTKQFQGVCGGAERTGSGPVREFLGGNARTTPVVELINAERPQLVVIVLGDTMGAYKMPNFPRTWVWQEVSQLTAAIGSTGTACVWVGPPWGAEGGTFGKTFERSRVLSSFLGKNVAPCLYVDSLAMAKPGEWPALADGQHLTAAAYKAWGEAISDAIANMPIARK